MLLPPPKEKFSCSDGGPSDIADSYVSTSMRELAEAVIVFFPPTI